MKKLIILFTTIFFIISSNVVLAASSSSYIGQDATQSSVETTLGVKNVQSMTLGMVNNVLSANLTGNVTDGSTMTIAKNTMKLLMLQNTDTGIDNLGYADLLLTLGVYDVNLKVINNTTLFSLAEAIDEYKALGGTIPSGRITQMQREDNLYGQLVSQDQSVSKTSAVFASIETLAMEDPDLQYATNTIVDISLKRYGVNPSSTLRSGLYNWVYNYIVDGNKWNGFFRSVNIVVNTKDNIIRVEYSQLNQASSFAPPADVTNQKVIALCIVIAILFLTALFVYRTKKYTISSE
jgi:hypothetical protein